MNLASALSVGSPHSFKVSILLLLQILGALVLAFAFCELLEYWNLTGLISSVTVSPVEELPFWDRSSACRKEWEKL